MIKTLVLCGEGINSHVETANAFSLAGSKVEIVSVFDFLETDLEAFDILAFPGGFSFGDEIRSGKLLAQIIKNKKEIELKKFIASGKPVIGICNGFQILVQLGVFESGPRSITLRANSKQNFLNEWVNLKVSSQKSFWTEGIQELFLPIRHGEGRLYTSAESLISPAFYYEKDVNGSSEQIAGLFNPDGNVLGLMPHPECALDANLFPDQRDLCQYNQRLFNNAVEYSELRQTKG